MNNREKCLLEQIKNYSLIQEDAEKLEQRLRSSGYSLTASYNMNGGGRSSLPSSKVETFAVRVIGIKHQLEEKRRIIHQIDAAILNAGLNKRERDLIECTMSGYSLSEYARRYNIYKSHIYKIRDRALKKMRDYIEKHEMCVKTG